MDFLIILFVFILPLAAIAVSTYCLIHIFGLKKAASKYLALCRLAGKDGYDE